MTGRSLFTAAAAREGRDARNREQMLDGIEKPRLATCSAEHQLARIHPQLGRTEFWLMAAQGETAQPWFDGWPEDVRQSLTVAARRWLTVNSERELVGTLCSVSHHGADTHCILTIFHVSRELPDVADSGCGDTGVARPPVRGVLTRPAAAAAPQFAPPRDPRCDIAGCGE